MAQQTSAKDRGFLEGQTAWITVRAGPVGREIAAALAKAGAAVGVGLLSRESAEPQTSEIASLDAMLDAVAMAGRTGVGGVCDMSSGEALQRFSAQIERDLGPISILVHVIRPAGTRRDLALLDAGLQDWLNIIEALRPSMMERRWGRIISVIDVSDRAGIDRQWKELAQTRLESLTRGVALNVGNSGVACFLLGRDAPREPGQIARLVTALCADEALPLSGQSVTLFRA